MKAMTDDFEIFRSRCWDLDRLPREPGTGLFCQQSRSLLLTHQVSLDTFFATLHGSLSLAEQVSFLLVLVQMSLSTCIHRCLLVLVSLVLLQQFPCDTSSVPGTGPFTNRVGLFVGPFHVQSRFLLTLAPQPGTARQRTRQHGLSPLL